MKIYALMTVVERKAYIRDEGWFSSSPTDSVKVFSSYESALEDMKNWRQHLKSVDEIKAALYGNETEDNSERPMSHYVSFTVDDENGDVVHVNIRQKIHIF